LVEDCLISCSNKASHDHKWTRPSMLGPSNRVDVYSMLRVVASLLEASLEVTSGIVKS